MTFGGDSLAWAVEAGALYGIEVYAWLEYGTQACYASFNAFCGVAANNVSYSQDTL